MNVHDALSCSPFRMAFNDRLRLRIGPMAPGGALHSKPIPRQASLSDESLKALITYEHILFAHDLFTAERFEAGRVAQDWRPALPEEGDVVDLLAWLGG